MTRRRRITVTALGVAGVLGVAAAAVGAAFIATFRTQFEPGLALIRRMNKAVFNPSALATAGAPGSATSVVEHIGRRSGATYRTPIGIVESDAGYLVTLPYGTTADWVKNVLAAGSANLIHEGATVSVVRPEVVPLGAVEGMLSAREVRNARLFGIDRFLVLQPSGDDTA